MGSIGTAKTNNFSFTSLEGNGSKTFVQLLRSVLQENNIPIARTERYQNGRIKGYGGVDVIEPGVQIERMASNRTSGPYKGYKDESIIIRRNDFISREDAQTIADRIKESDVYKHSLRDRKIKSTSVYFY